MTLLQARQEFLTHEKKQLNIRRPSFLHPFSVTREVARKVYSERLLLTIARANLKRFIELTGNDKCCLSAATSPSDAHAIDVKPNSGLKTSPMCYKKKLSPFKASFLNVQTWLLLPRLLNLRIIYHRIHKGWKWRMKNSSVGWKWNLAWEHWYQWFYQIYERRQWRCWSDPHITKEILWKKFLQRKLADNGMDFSRSTRLNEPQRVSIKCSRDVLLAQAESENEYITRKLTSLYNPAKIKEE